MVRPWIVVYTMVDFTVGIASTFGTKLPYCPVLVMSIIEKLNEGIRRISIGTLRVS